MRSVSLLAAGLVAQLAHAIPNAQPVPTKASDHELDQLLGWSPRPTEGPHYDLMMKRGLSERAATLSSGQLVGYFAPDSVCGYISGSIGAVVPCSSRSKCAAIAPIGNQPGAMGCCAQTGDNNCYFITACYNSADIASSKCDNGCQKDTNVRICTASTAPFCYGYTWPDISATIWGCESTSASTKDTVLFRYLGETDSRSWSAYSYTPSASGGSDSALVGAVSSISQQRSSPSASAVADKDDDHHTNIGAIVGGVVGGLAVVGATVFGIFFLLVRKRRARNAAAHADTAPAGAPAAGTPGTSAAVPAAAAGAGYGYEHKPEMQQNVHSPGTSPYAAKVDPHAPGQQGYDPRYSHFSEVAGSPAPPYAGPHGSQSAAHHQQPPAPMELDGSSSAPHAGAQGQPIFEAPGHDVPARPNATAPTS